MRSAKNIASLFFVLFLSLNAITQVKYPIDSALVNPLAYPREISANREIALVYDEKDPNNNNIKIHHKFFDVNQLNINDQNPAIALETGFPVYNGAPDNHGNKHIGTCSGDFNGDQVDDYIAGTQGTSNTIYLQTYNAQVLGTQMTVAAHGSYTNPGTLTAATANAGFIKLASGDFDNNDEDEVVLVFREDGSDELQINMYDFDVDLNIVEVGYQSDEFAILISNFESFDMQVVDLDYDGISEIVLAGSLFDAGEMKPFVKVYKVSYSNGIALIMPKEQTFVPTGITSSTRMSVAITTGDFNGDYIKEIALAYGIQITDNNGGQPDTWLRLFRVGDDTLNTPSPIDWLEKTVLLPQSYQSTESINYLANLDLDAGDVDGNGTEDIVLGTGSEIQLFTISSSFNIQSTDALGGTYSNDQDTYYDQFITVGDMNNDGKAEVLDVRNWVDQDNSMQYFSMNIHLWNPLTLTWQSLAVNNSLIPLGYSGTSSVRQYSVVIGDFDGDNIYFGNYEHHVYTDVVQPIIILNAPPTHSDNVGASNWRDVNGIWGGSDCSAFTSVYSETTTGTFTVQTTISDAWSVSSATSLEYNGLVASASLSLEASYGENYTNSNSTTSTTEEVTVTTTCFDDAIYASIVTYDVYEYPLYVGDTLIAYVVSVHPRLNEISYQWFGSKSDMGQYYIGSHEPGSLLSYRPFNSPQFSLTSQDEFNAGDNINISSSITNAWSITTTQVQESSADTERHLGLAASASVGAFGISEEVSGTYDWTGISTHTTAIGDAISVGVNIGTVPISSDDAVYSVKPYIFWGEGDEVVLDYEVNANSNFYQTNYSTQDPAWNMPWRLDEERGYSVPVQTKIRQSKSLWFDKKFPMAGDTITVTARVYNYSLVATESPVTVKFFYGNPYNGGVEVTNLDGANTIVSDAPIAPQQFKDLQFTIALPADFPYDGRLYARIDPDSVMNEVHEENNLCWRWLGPFFPISADDYELVGIEEKAQSSSTLLRCYPNPANEVLTIETAMKQSGIFELAIYNMQGKLVKNFGSIRANAMSRKQIDLGDFSSGMYVVQVRCENEITRANFIVK